MHESFRCLFILVGEDHLVAVRAAVGMDDLAAVVGKDLVAVGADDLAAVVGEDDLFAVRADDLTVVVGEDDQVAVGTGDLAATIGADDLVAVSVGAITIGADDLAAAVVGEDDLVAGGGSASHGKKTERIGMEWIEKIQRSVHFYSRRWAAELLWVNCFRELIRT